MPTPAPRSKTDSIRFEAALATVDDTVLAQLPEAASRQLPSRCQVAVQATIDGHPFDTVVEPDGRRGHRVRIDRALQEASGVVPGETARLTLEVARSGRLGEPGNHPERV